MLAKESPESLSGALFRLLIQTDSVRVRVVGFFTGFTGLFYGLCAFMANGL